MKRTKLALQIRESFWFLPSLYGFFAFIAAIASVNVDFHFSTEQLESVFPDLLVANSKLAVTMLSTLTQSILTITTITFSTIMIVLTTFSGQFSPRTLQNFVADRATQRVLAVFIAGFLYNLVTLLLMEGSGNKSLLVTPALSVLSGILCAAFFVFFIHHVAGWVQVNQLINKITRETLSTINRVYKEQSRFSSTEKTELEIDRQDRYVIRAENAGYVAMFDFQKLISLAAQNNTIIHFHIHIGDYVLKDTELLSYQADSRHPETTENQFRQTIKLEPERTSVQDIEFGIQKLVEIALRAISPAINDPHTAINCINRIGTILSELSKQPRRNSTLCDNNGDIRLIIRQRDLDHYLYKGLYQIRHYAREDLSVTVGILQALKLIAETSDPSTRQTVHSFAEYIIEGFDHEVLEDKDQKYLQRTWRDLVQN
ncbi:MAG TPA: DUF2254 domain-containing protein [Bacillales bacterium]|nr:DUF2254 domain-containing protein [Bacillales bacterium]